MTRNRLTLGAASVIVGSVVLLFFAATRDSPVILQHELFGPARQEIVFAGDSCLVSWGPDNGAVITWDLAVESRSVLQAQAGPIVAADVSADGRFLATADREGRVHVWDRVHERRLAEIHTPETELLRFCPDGTRLACGGGSGQITIWNVPAGIMAGRMSGDGESLYALAFAPENRTLITARSDFLQAWDIAEQREVARFDVPGFLQKAIGFSADRQHVVLLDAYGTTTRWDISTGRQIQRSPGHRRVQQATFSPSARVLAVATVSGQLRLRDTNDSAVQMDLRHMGPMTSGIAFSSSGRLVAAAGADGALRVWQLTHDADEVAWLSAVLRFENRRESGMTACWIGGLVIAGGIAVARWRTGLLLCIIFGLARDLVRKVIPGCPVWITVSTNLLWLAVAAGCVWRERSPLWGVLRRNAGLRLALFANLLALLPSAVISLFSYPSGWQFVVLGVGGYAFAWLGVILGYALARSHDGPQRLLAVFFVTHLVGVSGAIPEWLRWNIAGLGAVDADWHRSFATGTIQLVSGCYRSPDVLGWHAAQLVMLAAVLLCLPHGRRRLLAAGGLLLATVALLLAGRRKMTVMPLVFCTTWLIGYLRGRRRVVVLAVAVAVAAAWLPLRTLQRSHQAPEFLKYLACTGDDLLVRIRVNSTGVRETLQDAGFFGHGLGTAAQGRYYLGDSGPRLWQEDGICRLMAEAGIYGFLVTLAMLGCLGYAVWTAIRLNVEGRPWRWALLGMVLANVACYAVCHQLYSGDPTTTATVAICFGLALAPSGDPLASSTQHAL